MSTKRRTPADLARSALIALASMCCGIGNTFAAEETIWPMPEWRVSTPEQQGMDSAELAKLVAFGRTRSFDSLLITRHGRKVLDAYYAPYMADIPHVMNSATKAVVASLIAMLHRDGLLDGLNHPLLDLFTDRSVANVDERKKAITVQNLLDMTSGFDWDEGFQGGREQSLVDLGRSPDWVKFILDRPMAHAPGEVFYYNSGNSHLLSAIITRLTNKRAADYASTRLFAPLGIDPPFWRRDPQGLSTGAFGLALRPLDLAKIGYLYLRHGVWAGKELLPPGWVDSVNRATVSMNAPFDPGLKYHNQFWAMPDLHLYMAVGYHCQVIMIFPDLDIVAVMTARDFCPFRKIANEISGAVKSDGELPANPDGTTQLTRELNDVSIEKPSDVGPTSEVAATISGKTYKFPDNALNIKSLTLFLTDAEPRYSLEIDTHDPFNSLRRLDGPIGLDGLYRRSKPTDFGLRAVKASWEKKDTFVVDVQYVGQGEQRKWFLTFDGNKLNLRGKARDGREISIDGETGG